MTESVHGKIVNYRVGIRTQMSKHCLVQVLDSAASKTGQLVGRKAILKYGKQDLVGRIVGLHGRKGALKVKFRRGVPGDALGAIVEVCG